MSANKNLSKLALKVNTSGEVTDAGLESTYVSNAFFQDSTNPNLVSNGYFESVYTAADVLTKIKTVDGAGSGLDADTLDGANSTFFTNASNINTGTLATARLSGTYPISVSGSADTVDGLEATDLTSNNYVQGRFSSNGYMQSYVSTEVSNLVDSAPSTLNTLNELAAALGDDSNFSTTVTTAIGLRATNTYVNSTFTSNNYVQGRFTSNNYITTRIGIRATNTYVQGTFSSNNYLQTQLGTKLNSSSYTAADVLTKIKTVDGAGSGLDADLLDGKTSTNFTSNNYVQTQLGTKLNSSSYTASDVLTKIKTVDGAGSGLDADLLDGKASTDFTSNNYVKSIFTSNNYLQENVFPVGAGSDKVFYENDQNVTTNYTITTGKNAMSAGPITLDPGVTVTIPSGSEWSIT